MDGEKIVYRKFEIKENNYSELLKHNFWGSFDSGVIFIFLSFYIWGKTSNLTTVAIAFIIPLLVNTVFDYYLSKLSDRVNRVKLIIIGNVGSAIFLCFYGFTKNIYMLYLLIFLKSIFVKIYESSLEPFKREVIDRESYKDYISQENTKISLGASIGGFLLMLIYSYYESMLLVFLISGLIELYSTKYLLKLNNYNKKIVNEVEEEEINITWLKRLTIIYTFEAFGIALIINRMLIFLNDVHKVSVQKVEIIFFIVYGFSNIIAGRIYKKFERLKLDYMFIMCFLLQSLLLLIFIKMTNLNLIIGIWFIFELVSNITGIYSKDKMNRNIISRIGEKFSKFRIKITIGSILGQIIIGQIWDKFGIEHSFYFSSLLLFLLALGIWIREYKEIKILETE